jgi:hypothetical protein
MRMVNRVAQDEVRVRRANLDPGDARGHPAARFLDIRRFHEHARPDRPAAVVTMGATHR